MTKMSDNLEGDGGVSAVMSGLSWRFGRDPGRTDARGLMACTPPPPENPGARLSPCAPPGEPRYA